MSDYFDPTLTPESPEGLAQHMGESPYPFNDIADVEPKAPRLGDYPHSWDTDVVIDMDTHDNTDFDLHRSGLSGPPKPGSFG